MNIEELFRVDWHTTLVSLFIFAAVFLSVDDIATKIRKRFGLTTQKELERIEERDAIKKHSCELEEIQEQIKCCRDKLNAIQQMVLEMQNKIDESKRHELKDRIGQSYRYYHERYVKDPSKPVWNLMEKEAFDGLIQDYESHGGENSFVHDVCQTESLTWLIKDAK